ncbi:hypothetical protein LUZ60_003226 [Juncus effusus]|nr:hypothetical protein LUZ60_003226 [Juncus effusus]
MERMIFQSLGIEKNCDAHLESLVYGVRFAKYGDQPDNEARVSFPYHRDPNFITIVRQNGVEGLEVLNKEEEWIRVAPAPDSFTVMIGDSMTVLTNGRLIAPIHRVSVDRRRYSVIFSSFSKEGHLIGAPKELIDEHHPLKYPPFDVYKYLDFIYSPIAVPALKAKETLQAFYEMSEE